MYFGERLEYLRHEKKLTQKQLADKLGMSSGMISSYERSISLPDIAQLKKFCDFLMLHLHISYVIQIFLLLLVQKKINYFLSLLGIKNN